MSDMALSALATWLSPTSPYGLLPGNVAIGQALSNGEVNSAVHMQNWLSASLQRGDIAADAVLLSQAYTSETDHRLAELSALSYTAHSPEGGAESMMRGSQFVGLTRDAWGIDLPDMALPIAVGYTARLMDVPQGPALKAFIEAEVDGALLAVSKTGKLDDAAMSAVKLALAGAIEQTATAALGASLGDIQTGARSAPALILDD